MDVSAKAMFTVLPLPPKMRLKTKTALGIITIPGGNIGGYKFKKMCVLTQRRNNLFVKQLNMTTSTPVTTNFNYKKACENILNTIIRKNTSQLKYNLSNALDNL